MDIYIYIYIFVSYLPKEGFNIFSLTFYFSLTPLFIFPFNYVSIFLELFTITNPIISSGSLPQYPGLISDLFNLVHCLILLVFLTEFKASYACLLFQDAYQAFISLIVNKCTQDKDKGYQLHNGWRGGSRKIV